MKLLLDEQMPRQILRFFPDDVIVDTVQSQGWSGIKNGALLTLAAEHGYDALISADKNMSYQQSADSLPVSVVVLQVHRLRLERLLPLLPKAMVALASTKRPQFLNITG